MDSTLRPMSTSQVLDRTFHLSGFAAGVLAGPIATIALALLYYDERVRKEAFDLQLMMEAVGQQTSQAAVAAAPTVFG